MTTLISALTVAALAVLLATAAVGLVAILVRVGSPSTVPADGPTASAASGNAALLRRVGDAGLGLGLALLAAALVARAIATGHAPWSNLHEFSLAFAAAILGTHLLLARSHPMSGLAPFTALLAAGLVAFGLGFDDRIDPLVPALQQPLLLTVREIEDRGIFRHQPTEVGGGAHDNQRTGSQPRFDGVNNR